MRCLGLKDHISEDVMKKNNYEFLHIVIINKMTSFVEK